MTYVWVLCVQLQIYRGVLLQKMKELLATDVRVTVCSMHMHALLCCGTPASLLSAVVNHQCFRTTPATGS